ncbi:ribonuclease Y [Clostridia bacterium]|nr:ribonuclease Y [Clostridia bacterium]
MPVELEIVFIVAALVVGITAGFFTGAAYRKKIAEAKIGSAEVEAKRLLEDALKEGETRKKESLLEAKEEIIRNKNEAEREIKERRSEVSRLEKRIVQKEETLDKKTDQAEKKEELLAAKIKAASVREEEIEAQIVKGQEKLVEISGYTPEVAREIIMRELDEQLMHEKAMKIAQYETQYKEEAEAKAKEIILLSIQRYASDYVAEATISSVPLPNDEMKGRIIGREGRNIRTIETLTGVDLIIDDTPEAITLSCFDTVRREIARLTLEKLIADGRIHPTRIEEAVAKATREVESIIKIEGERATFETGVRGINPELVKILGRLKYRTSFGQNVLGHSIEVSHLSGMIAAELGADVASARRAGLLHDIGKAVPQDEEGSHIQNGVEIAKRYKEHRDVIHAIEAHHGDIEAETVVAVIVQAADAISAARPGARRENLENYIKRLEKLEEIANSFEGIDKSFAIQAGREIRIIVNPDSVSDDKMALLARDVVQKIEADLQYPGQIKIHLVRESRVIDYAK